MNIESILKENGICVTMTKGDSMQPMLVEGRDKVVIVPASFPLKKYDVPVYRRLGHYTMHRIVKVTKNGYIICGDNRARLEKDITDRDIIGVLEGFYQNDKYIDCKDPNYLLYAKRTVRKIPVKIVKDIIIRALRRIKRMGRRK